MLIYFENYGYTDKEVIKPYLDGSLPIVNEDGGYKVKHLGYLFVSSSKYTGPIFILPKLFLQKENEEKTAKLTLFGIPRLYPESIYNTDVQNSPLLSRMSETFLPELSLWMYRAMARYLNEVQKEEDEEAWKELFYVTPDDGSHGRDFLSTVVCLMDFLVNHRSLFTQVSIIKHSGNSAVDWHKTMAKDPYCYKGKPYYLELQSKNKTININEELIVIYYSVLNYLRNKFKFPIQLGDVPYDLMSTSEIQHYLDSGFGERRLRDIRGKYYRDDLKYLWTLLYSFFFI